MLVGIQVGPEGQDRLVQLDYELPAEAGEVKTSYSFSEEHPLMVKLIQNKNTSHVFLQMGDGDVYQLLLKPGKPI